MVEKCPCSCHRTLTGDIRAAGQIGDFWLRFDLAQKEKDAPNNDPPDVTDILAAACACPTCIAIHAPALLNHPTSREREPWTDPPNHPPPAEAGGDDQADGN